MVVTQLKVGEGIRRGILMFGLGICYKKIKIQKNESFQNDLVLDILFNFLEILFLWIRLVLNCGCFLLGVLCIGIDGVYQYVLFIIFFIYIQSCELRIYFIVFK